MTSMRFFLSLVTLLCLGALAVQTVQAQTAYEFDGAIHWVPDPLDVVDDSIVPGSPFSGSFTLGEMLYEISVIPGHLAVYGVDGYGEFQVEGRHFSQVYFPLYVVVVNDMPTTNPMTGETYNADVWILQGIGSDDGAIDGPHMCSVAFLDYTNQKLAEGDTSYFVPESLEGWFAIDSDGQLVEGAAGIGCNDGMSNPPVYFFQGVMNHYGPGLTIVAEAGSDELAECASPSGTTVMLDGSGSSAPPEAVYSWSEPVTGQTATGVMAEMSFPVGTFQVTLEVSADGKSDTDPVQVFVRDTVAPLIDAAMLPNGNSGHNFDIVATATDTCDPSPVVSARVGAEVDDGGLITIAQPDDEGLVRFMASIVNLVVEAEDSAGNRSTQTASP
jgi:hypothetical protein